MNFTEYALKNRAFVYFFVFVLVVGGIYSFFTMSKLEDPAITVKQAMVVTAYPGKTPMTSKVAGRRKVDICPSREMTSPIF